MDTIFVTEKSPKFECIICDYKCSKNSDYIKHTETKKHKLLELGYKKNTDHNEYFCKCGKKYSYHSGLWKHKKVCSSSATNSPNGDKKTRHLLPISLPTNNEIIEIIKVQMR